MRPPSAARSRVCWRLLTVTRVVGRAATSHGDELGDDGPSQPDAVSHRCGERTQAVQLPVTEAEVQGAEVRHQGRRIEVLPPRRPGRDLLDPGEGQVTRAHERV